jgi:hypothetical protein
VTVIHGWQDHVIPVDHSLRDAREFKAELHLLQGGHRLEGHLALLAALLAAFWDETVPLGRSHAA